MSLKHRGHAKGDPVTYQTPLPAGGVQMETFLPWTLVRRGLKKQVITPLDAPQEFLEILGLQMPVQGRQSPKTMAQIFTSTGKKTSEDRERRRTVDLSCLGQCNYTAPFSTQEPVDEAA